ncbi:MAG: Dihydrolipoyl dehydrogenase [Pseudomonadota bacterium]
MALIDIQVPDIGDFDEVAVIELLVKPGDTVKAEQSLITVESDKASMEIPSSHAGVVKELRIKLGDKVKQGSVVLVLDAEGAAASAAPVSAAAPVAAPTAPVASATPPAPTASSFGGSADIECDVLVLGGGPGGYSAAFRAADLGLNVVIVERYATLGGVCLNVGCIPSKALLHVASVMDEVSHMAALGVDFGAPVVNIDKLRGHKEKVISKLTGGLAAMAKMRKVTTVRGFRRRELRHRCLHRDACLAILCGRGLERQQARRFELGGDVGAPDEVRRDDQLPERLHQLPQRLLPQHPPLQLSLHPQPHPLAVQPTSSAMCSCWAVAPAVTQQRSAPLTSA